MRGVLCALETIATDAVVFCVHSRPWQHMQWCSVCTRDHGKSAGVAKVCTQDHGNMRGALATTARMKNQLQELAEVNCKGRKG
jgi:hypothetical protein